METPTPLVSLDDLDKPVLRSEDCTYPAPDSTDNNPMNGLRTDYRSMDTHAPTDEELASHVVGVSNDLSPVAPPETPYLTKKMGLHRQLFQNLLAKQDSSPPTSPLVTQESIVTAPTSAIDMEPTRWSTSADATDSPG